MQTTYNLPTSGGFSPQFTMYTLMMTVSSPSIFSEFCGGNLHCNFKAKVNALNFIKTMKWDPL